jgi:hypothetical protein
MAVGVNRTAALPALPALDQLLIGERPAPLVDHLDPGGVERDADAPLLVPGAARAGWPGAWQRAGAVDSEVGPMVSSLPEDAKMRDILGVTIEAG